MSALIRIAAFLAAAALSPAALAAEASMDKADVVWMLVSTTLVLFMTIPGIALFYGGMARKKNVLSILAQTTVICCALTLVWFAAGYSLAFGPGSAFVGGLSHVFLNGLDINSMSGSIPTLLFVCFQMTFAILTATLMIGAFAGRMKFSAMLIFMILWSLCVYSPVCHWVWAEGGFFFDMGALDYAGGTVVHINAGIAGLVACLMLGRRTGYGSQHLAPANLTFAMIGACLLWPRVESPLVAPLDLAAVGTLTFENVDDEAFPALTLARRALRVRSGMCVVLNGADEEAVALFLGGKCRFTDITAAVAHAMDEHLTEMRRTGGMGQGEPFSLYGRIPSLTGRALEEAAWRQLGRISELDAGARSAVREYVTGGGARTC